MISFVSEEDSYQGKMPTHYGARAEANVRAAYGVVEIRERYFGVIK